MSDRIIFNYEFRFPVELWYLDYLLEEEIYLDGRVLIVKNTKDKDWWIDEYYVRGWKEVDGRWVDEWVMVSPWKDDGWLRDAMARQLQLPEHRASIEDMIRKMSGADAVVDFGHDAINSGGFHVDTWGAGPFVIRINGREYRFEDSDRFGPWLIRTNGDLRSNPIPPEKSPFWTAYERWRDQGRRVADDGQTCLWE